MTKDEIIKYLQFDSKESSVYMPNESFQDIHKHLKGSQAAFGYTFYYLISWLYRHAKYGQVEIDTKLIKSILGINENYKGIDHIIRKKGILDQLNYTYSSTDYPIVWDFNNGDIEFTMLTDLDSDMKKYVTINKGRNYKIKIPTKGLHRDIESENDGLLDGTFYDISNTHHIPFTVFLNCMSNSDIGYVGFYVYGYLKYRCQWFDGKYNCSIERIASDLKLGRNTTDKYLTNLTTATLISYKENLNWYHYGDKIVREAHTYAVI